MNFFKRVLYGIFFFLILFFSTSCLEKINQQKRIALNCSLGFNLNDVEYIEKYYSNFIDEKSQYIAFKRFSHLHFPKLVSLVKNDDRYILSVSLQGISNGLLFKEIDEKVGQRVFEEIGEIKQLDFLDGGDHWHPDCVFVGLKRLNFTSISNLLNPPSIFINNYKNNINSGLRLYSVLSTFANEQLPNHVDIILNNNEVNDYVPATEYEPIESFQTLLRNPFFELENTIRK